MMSKEMLAELRRMVEEAEIMGCTLLLEQRANLVEYTKDGKVKATHLYDYEDPKCLAHIREQLDQISNNLQRKWKPEFLRIAPALEPLNWSMEFGYAEVEVTDADGEKFFYPYGGDGVVGLSEDISDYLLDLHVDEYESQNPQDDQKPAYKQEQRTTGQNLQAPLKNQTPHKEKPEEDPEEIKQHEQQLDHEGRLCLAIGMHLIDIDQLLASVQPAHCGGKHCQGCDNKQCTQDHQLIETLWYHINEEERQKLMETLSPERQAAIKACLERK